MPDAAVVEGRSGATVGAVVFAVSAAAPMTESDCALFDGLLDGLLDALDGATGPVLAAVTKVDAHRCWRDVLAADRATLAARNPGCGDMPWVGVAAAPGRGAPGRGAPDIDELVGLLRRGLADTEGLRQRRLRGLTDRRRRIVDDHRRVRSTNALTVRAGVQQARMALTQSARDRCTRMVVELRAEAATLSRSEAASFDARVRAIVATLSAEVERGIDRELGLLADRVRLPLPAAPLPQPDAVVADPLLTSRAEENQLTVVLGAGFGLGVALASGRLLTSVMAGLDVVGLVAGAAVGLAVTVWVVGVRGLLHTRAAFDRWVVEAGAAARSSLDARIATRLLAAEVALLTSAAERDVASAARTSKMITEIDAEIRALR
jgi:hypothetical protein